MVDCSLVVSYIELVERTGAWRSPVAHLNGVQGVGGSNPPAPTID
jgi:hypothetical protein